MASIQSLPTEILLNIFEQPVISQRNLMSINGVCAKWRNILQAYKPAQRTLWLRPFPAAKKTRHHPMGPNIQIEFYLAMQRVPATIWNGFKESWTLQFTVLGHKPPCNLPADSVYPTNGSYPQNPIFQNFTELLRIIFPGTVRSKMSNGSDCTTLTFSDMEELRGLINIVHDDQNVKWRQMLISQEFVRRILVHMFVGVRSSSRDFYFGPCFTRQISRKKKAAFRMGHFVDFARTFLVDVAENLEQDENGIKAGNDASLWW